MSEAHDNTIRLRDGRMLGYAEYGDPDGKPLFFFHGFPNSRVGARLAGSGTAAAGVRVIALDRPGIGLSTFKRKRTIGEWPGDVAEAADALGIDRFAVLGVSGGGPYAAACAAKIPHRLTAVAIVSGAGPFDAPATKGLSLSSRLLIGLMRRLPLLLSVMFWFVSLAVRLSPGAFFWLMTRSASPVDRALLSRPEIWNAMRDDIAEAFRQGSRGTAYEAKLYLRRWDFRLEDIPMEVHLWHGEADTVVPVSMGRYVAEKIPHCRARFYPGEGHLLAVERMEEINAALFGLSPPPARRA